VISTGSTILIGSLRIPVTAVALSTSVAAHGALLVALAWVPLPGRDHVDEPPSMTLARGEPIQVRLTTEPPAEESTPRINAIEPDIVPLERVADTRLARHVATPLAGATAQQFARLTPIPRSVESTDVVVPVTPNDGAAPMPPALAMDMPPLPPLEVLDCVPARLPEAPPVEATSAPTNARTGVREGVIVHDLPRPVYPRRCIRLGQEGTCVLTIEVRADGTPGRIEVLESSGHRRLDEAAIDAARQGRFRAARRDGRAVADTIEVPFEFHLK